MSADPDNPIWDDEPVQRMQSELADAKAHIAGLQTQVDMLQIAVNDWRGYTAKKADELRILLPGHEDSWEAGYLRALTELVERL